MQRSCVVVGLAFLVAAVGVAPAFAQFAGFLHIENEFYLDDFWPDALEVDLEVGAEYSVSGWSFGTLFDAGKDGLEDLAFLATGTLGAFHVYSMYGQWDLDDEYLWTDWDNAVWVDVFGTELWCVFSLQTEEDQLFSLSGSGFAVGGHSVVGNAEVWGEIGFNLWELAPWIYWNDLETVMDQNLACDFIAVEEPTCAMDFSYAQLFVEFPVCCLDVTGWIGFDCYGFEGVELWAKDIPIGNTAFVIDWIDLWYEVDEKGLDLWFGIDAGDVVCITPYLSLDDESEYAIAGIAVDALELVCTLGDVTLTVSELFSADDWFIGTDGAIHSYDFDDAAWIIPPDCVDVAYAVDEAIAIEIHRDACCGHGATLGLYNYFDTDFTDTLFSWLGIRARLETPLSSSLSTYVETWIWYDGIESIAVGIDVTWGALRSLPKDLDCCLFAIP